MHYDNKNATLYIFLVIISPPPPSLSAQMKQLEKPTELVTVWSEQFLNEHRFTITTQQRNDYYLSGAALPTVLSFALLQPSPSPRFQISIPQHLL